MGAREVLLDGVSALSVDLYMTGVVKSHLGQLLCSDLIDAV